MRGWRIGYQGRGRLADYALVNKRVGSRGHLSSGPAHCSDCHGSYLDGSYLERQVAFGSGDPGRVGWDSTGFVDPQDSCSRSADMATDWANTRAQGT
jgi:hypothetical protein